MNEKLVMAHIANCAAKYNRSKKCIDDEPGGPIGGQVGSIFYVVSLANISAGKEQHFAPKQGRKCSSLPYIAALEQEVLIGKKLVRVIGGDAE